MDSEYYYFFGIGICFLFSCYFSMCETALTSLSAAQASRLSEARGWITSSLKQWIRQPNRLLSTILVLNTACNTAAPILATLYIEKYHPTISIVAVTAAITLWILTFGEIAPKMLARTYAETLAPVLCFILIGFNWIVYPITYLVTSFVSVLLRAIGITMRDRQMIRQADIEHMVLLAGHQGSIERDKTKILSSIFQFTKRRVKDIMIPRDRISAIAIDTNLVDVLDIVRHENHSRYPVFNKDLDRIVGFFHVRDLFGILRNYSVAQSAGSTQGIQALSSFSLRTCLRRAFFISEQALISRVLNEMKTNRIHLAIVKDEWGNVVGLVTLEDILEEVFGEIEDEHDEHTAAPLVDLYSTGIEVEGSESLVDLKSKFGIEIEPGESFSTINGFLLHYASHQQITPKMVVIWKNYVFSIVSVKDGEIETVRITEIPEEKKE